MITSSINKSCSVAMLDCRKYSGGHFGDACFLFYGNPQKILKSVIVCQLLLVSILFGYDKYANMNCYMGEINLINDYS